MSPSVNTNAGYWVVAFSAVSYPAGTRTRTVRVPGNVLLRSVSLSTEFREAEFRRDGACAHPAAMADVPNAASSSPRVIG
jgi:hypothetical protein